MAWVSRVAAACFVVALPILLITTNVRFLASEVRFYERGFRAHDVEQTTGLALPELDRSAREIVNYFENDASTLRVVVKDDGEEVALFNARETEHMKDVKWLMQLVFRVNEVTLAYVLTYVACVFLWAGRSFRSLARQSLLGIAVGGAGVGAVGVFAIAGFESTWRRFHEVVFSNDLWKLNPATDRLIQMFPEPFWQEETFVVAALTVAEAVIIVGAALACLVLTRASRAGTAPRGEARGSGAGA